MNKLILFLIASLSTLIGQDVPSTIFEQKKCYPVSNEPIDVVFPCHPKDRKTIDLAIKGIRENGKNVRRIMVVSTTQYTDQAEWIDESIFPFTKESIAIEIFNGNREAALNYLNSPKSRIGWIFAQFIKMYSVVTIPNISSNALIIDADTIFLNPVEFIDETGIALYNPGTENHQPYFDHGARLLPGFKKIFSDYSGISHHLLFQRSILEDMFNLIREIHRIEPWQAMCRCIDIRELPGSAMADYELYFNFAFAKTDQVKLRFLKWDQFCFDYNKILEHKKNGYHFVSCHHYM